jgi:hypothetical protein
MKTDLEALVAVAGSSAICQPMIAPVLVPKISPKSRAKALHRSLDIFEGRGLWLHPRRARGCGMVRHCESCRLMYSQLDQIPFLGYALAAGTRF